MPSLKSLRLRINSVKSTRKITQAMKMVAAAKLRRAQTQAEAARPYAERMERMLASLGASVAGAPDAPKLLVGTGADKVHLLVVVTAERGLCGGFNTNVGRFARAQVRALEAEGKTVKIITVGRKGAVYLKRELASRIVAEISFANKNRIGFEDAAEVIAKITEMLDGGEFAV
ncbi:MAG: F0F1 ATP synthase subunit gamma, partial [Roseomonas sp.]|nr:F0F1 ATP synthase subunit gamma [Roseomonas sp.]